MRILAVRTGSDGRRRPVVAGKSYDNKLRAIVVRKLIIITVKNVERALPTSPIKKKKKNEKKLLNFQRVRFIMSFRRKRVARSMSIYNRRFLFGKSSSKR